MTDRKLAALTVVVFVLAALLSGGFSYAAFTDTESITITASGNVPAEPADTPTPTSTPTSTSTPTPTTPSSSDSDSEGSSADLLRGSVLEARVTDGVEMG